jgi:hypothetical protein
MTTEGAEIMKARPSHHKRLGVVAAAAVASTLVIGLDPGAAFAHGHSAQSRASVRHAAAIAHVRVHRGAHRARAHKAQVATTKPGPGHATKPTTATVSRPPTCSLLLISNGGAGRIRVFGRDLHNGLASGVVVNEVNFHGHVPAFVPGTRRRVPIVLRKINTWEPSVVTLRFTNTLGISSTCTFTFLRIARHHAQEVRSISRTDHIMMISNFGVSQTWMRINNSSALLHLDNLSKLINLNSRFNRNHNRLGFTGIRGHGDAFLVVWDGSVGQSRMVS